MGAAVWSVPGLYPGGPDDGAGNAVTVAASQVAPDLAPDPAGTGTPSTRGGRAAGAGGSGERLGPADGQAMVTTTAAVPCPG